MSLIKSPEEIIILREAGKKLAEIVREAVKLAKPGLTLDELDQRIDQHILSLDARPSFKGFEGYPKASCLSIDTQVVHGIPNQRVLEEGMLLGIDVGLWYRNLCVDHAMTVAIGTVGAEEKRLLKATQEALKIGIQAARPTNRVGAISRAIQEVAEQKNLGIVRALTGHGVGHKIHEEPSIPNFGHSSDGILLRPGMVLAIEPMFTLGKGEVLTEIDGWGIVTADGSTAAHFEHTVLITKHGNEILTI